MTVLTLHATLHYELQCLIVCPDNPERCHEILLKAAGQLNEELKASSVGFFVEVRDIRRAKSLYRAIEGGMHNRI
jgi:hypothetical protein